MLSTSQTRLHLEVQGTSAMILILFLHRVRSSLFLAIVTALLVCQDYTQVEAKPACLVQKTEVRYRQNRFGIIYKANVTVTEWHRCQLYKVCCDKKGGTSCCLDYGWFLVTVVVILLFVCLCLAYRWHKRHHRRRRVSPGHTQSSPSVVRTTAAASSSVLRTWSSRVVARLPGWVRAGSPKPPSYTSVSPQPVLQPGVSLAPQPEQDSQGLPPPYTSTVSVSAAQIPNRTRTLVMQSANEE